MTDLIGKRVRVKDGTHCDAVGVAVDNDGDYTLVTIEGTEKNICVPPRLLELIDSDEIVDPKQYGAEPDFNEINRAPHYNQHPSGVECIQIIEHFTANIAFAVKYCWRHGLKPGNSAIKDLKKARYYISREIERLENEPV